MSLDVTNSCLLRIDRRTVNGAGDASWIQGADIAAGAVECNAGEGTNTQKWTIGAAVENADRMIALGKDDLALGAPDEMPPKVGDRLLVAIEGEDPAGELLEIVAVKDRVLGDLSHWELFGKRAVAD